MWNKVSKIIIITIIIIIIIIIINRAHITVWYLITIQ